MNTLKRIVVALLVLLPLWAGTAIADTEHGYSRIFIFGASFIDPGNRYADTGLISYPPFLDPFGPVAYEIGGHRATNGRTWVEVMAHEMKLAKWAKPAYRHSGFGNYAYDHAHVRDVFPPFIKWGPSMGEQIDRWAVTNGYCGGAPMNDTLFVLDSGAADLLDILQPPVGENPELIVFELLGAIRSHIAYLHGCGARNFLIADLLPLGIAPGVALVGNPDIANQKAEEFNEALQAVINGIVNHPDYPGLNISTTGFFEFGLDLVTFAEEFGFTHVTEPCITYGVIEGAYCDKPKEYLFWDLLHPTKATHALLGRHALRQMPVLD
jgi:phospholipase/lecithinase/hemolysin